MLYFETDPWWTMEMLLTRTALVRLAQQRLASTRLWVLVSRCSFSLKALRTMRLRRTLRRGYTFIQSDSSHLMRERDMSVVTIIIPWYIPDNNASLYYFQQEDFSVEYKISDGCKMFLYLLSCSMVRNQSYFHHWKEKLLSNVKLFFPKFSKRFMDFFYKLEWSSF